MAGHETTIYDAPRLEPLLNIRGVATVLGISRDGVYKLMREGELEPIRVGARARFEPADVRAYLERKREGRDAKPKRKDT
jgi:excisionase family DNA binding protein